MNSIQEIATDEVCKECDLVYSHLYIDEEKQDVYRVYTCNVFNTLDVARKVDCKKINKSKHYEKEMIVYSINEIN